MPERVTWRARLAGRRAAALVVRHAAPDSACRPDGAEWFGWGRDCLAAGRAPEAVIALGHAAVREPGRLDVWLALAAARTACGDPPAAAGALRRAAALADPEQAAQLREQATQLRHARRTAPLSRRVPWALPRWLSGRRSLVIALAATALLLGARHEDDEPLPTTTAAAGVTAPSRRAGGQPVPLVQAVRQIGRLPAALRQLVTALNAQPGWFGEVSEYGRSANGRPLLAVHLGSTVPTRAGRHRILVVGGQHGDEPAGVMAQLVFLDRLVNQRLGRLVLPPEVDLWLVPCANPDGRAARRRSAWGRPDLNRDWGRFATPEAARLAELIAWTGAECLLDLHEQVPRDGEGPYVEFAGDLAGASLRADLATYLRAYDCRVPFRTASGTGPLLHRWFNGSRGGLGVLVESRYEGTEHHQLTNRGEYQFEVIRGVLRALTR